MANKTKARPQKEEAPEKGSAVGPVIGLVIVHISLGSANCARLHRRNGGLHAKPSRSFADRDPMRRCGDCPYAERKCGKQIRRHVERCVSDKIRTVSARLPRRSTSGQRDRSGCQHRRFPLWSRFAQWLGESHRVHGRELRRRIGTSFGQFRQRNLARSHGKRELRRRLDCAATIIAPANVGASAPRFPSRVRFSRKPAAASCSRTRPSRSVPQAGARNRIGAAHRKAGVTSVARFRSARRRSGLQTARQSANPTSTRRAASKIYFPGNRDTRCRDSVRMRRDINLWQAAGSTLHQSDSQQVTAIVVPSGSGNGIAAVELVAASTKSLSSSVVKSLSSWASALASSVSAMRTPSVCSVPVALLGQPLRHLPPIALP